MKLNTRNLRSRASTVFHEWLHINGASAEICEGGCEDNIIIIGGAKELAYKSGRTKLLAYNNVAKSALNNDNFVYFATARWMEFTFKAYPEYPRMWDPKLSRLANEANEAKDPGAQASIQAWKLQDTFVDNGELPVDVSKSGPTPEVEEAAPVAGYYPVPENIVCEPSDGSPLIDDCVHVLETLYMHPNSGLLTGSEGGSWWVGYVQTCAIALYYTGDWSQDPQTGCSAHMQDVLNHAKMIMNACGDHRSGKVGGHIVWDVLNRLAQVEIIHTNGDAPQSQA